MKTWPSQPKPIGNAIRDWLEDRGITEQDLNERLLLLHLKYRWIPRRCFCGELRRWLNRQRWLHWLARRCGFSVEADSGDMPLA